MGTEETPPSNPKPAVEKEPSAVLDSIGSGIATGEDTFAFGAPRMPQAKPHPGPGKWVDHSGHPFS